VTKIAATEEKVFKVAASPEEVYTFFSELETLREAMTGVESCEVLPEGLVHWVLKEQVGKGIRFQPNYVVTYDGNGTDHVRCRSVAGNMDNDWDAWIKPVAEGSEIRYRETVAADLPITALLACLIKPMVVKELRRDVNTFLDRVRERLSRRALVS
jgi:carbon monoxide dehydrogenase subunit G